MIYLIVLFFTLLKKYRKMSFSKYVVLYCTYMHPYIYTVSRTAVQLIQRM